MISEAFHEVLTYKSPSSYKTSAAASHADQVFVLETLARLSNSFNKFLGGPAADLTRQEAIYFGVISLLSTLVPFAASVDRAAPLTDVFAQMADGVKAAMATLRAEIAQFDSSEVSDQVSLLGSMHGLALFRDVAVAAKHAAQWILAFNEREKERDRSGKSNLPKEMVAQAKTILSEAEAALKEGKAWAAKLKDIVNSRDFDRKVQRWAFEGFDEVQSVVGDGPMRTLVESWQANVKGWLQVKWD